MNRPWTPPIKEYVTPADVEAALKHNGDHRAELDRSLLCGCYYCLEIYSPTEIREWADRGRTAICPRCEIDAVLPGSKVDLAKEFLEKIHYWQFQITFDWDGNQVAG